MRIKLLCSVINSSPVLKFNYKHKIKSMIYDSLGEYGKQMNDSNDIAEYAFSNIIFTDKYKKINGGFIPSKTFEINISTVNNNIRNGIFSLKGTMKMFSPSFFFKIDNVISLNEEEDLNEKTFYSEFLVTRKNENGTTISYFPYEKEFKDAIFKNLIKKYRNITKDTESTFNLNEMDIIHSFSNKKSENGLEKFKKDCDIKYFKFQFKLKCPLVLKKIAYMNGIGGLNNCGFGFVEII